MQPTLGPWKPHGEGAEKIEPSVTFGNSWCQRAAGSDCLMNWDAVGALAELFGAAAVVLESFRTTDSLRAALGIDAHTMADVLPMERATPYL